jgi:double-strand break repair protein MRE11
MPTKKSGRDADIIRVLISTDNHIGFLEKDPVRGDDSFRAFEEVLALARSNGVDMVLLGGDLFHDNKPSRRTLIRTMSILREHCMGDEPISLAVRSDPDKVNYMDPSYAVSLPIFIIHGNHDDPTGAAGADALSAIDYLAQANLVTYFGKAPDSRRITVTPILLQKGATKLALYGFGNIRDDVLHETWANTKQVHWLSPAEDENVEDDVRWFNLFVLHQNRAARGTTKAVADTMLPNWLDYVVWGHEHDSIPDLTKTEPPIVQPGSTVATSLSEGESLQKHVVLLEICKGRLKHRPIPLQTIRQFEFGEVSLGDAAHGLATADTKGIEQFLNRKVEDMIRRQEAEFDAKRYIFESGQNLPAKSGVTYPPPQFYIDHLPRILRQPLVRLRVEYTGGFEALNPQRFGQGYVGRSACATEIVLFYKRRPKVATRPFLRGRIGATGAADEADSEINGGYNTEGGLGIMGDGGIDMGDEANGMQIPSLVEYFLYHKEAGGTGLKFLELDKLAIAVDEFVAKSENRAIPDYVVSYMKMQQDNTLDKLERKGAVMTDDELTAGFQELARNAAARAFQERAVSEAPAAVPQQPSTPRDIAHNPRGSDQGRNEPSVGDAVNGKPADDDPTLRLENVHMLLSRNPRTAAVAKAARSAAQLDAENEEVALLHKTSDVVAGHDDDEDDEDDDEDDSYGTRTVTRRGASSRAHAKPPARGRGRGRGGRAASQVGSRKPRVPPSPVPSNPRSSGRKPRSAAPSSFVIDSDDDVDHDDDAIVESEEEEEVLPPSRKRKAPSGGASASGRAASRGRSSRRTASGSSGFGTRGHVRNVAPTIDLGDDSE